MITHYNKSIITVQTHHFNYGWNYFQSCAFIEN